MFRKMMIVVLGLLFLCSLGSVSMAADTAMGNSQCSCPQNCQCEHCTTGKGACMCKTGAPGCSCPKGCGCEHCTTGKGACMCKTGAPGCCCPKGCGCEHCATGKGACMCKSSAPGSACSNCARRAHCRTAAGAEANPPVIANEKTVLSQRGRFKVSYTTEPAEVPVNSFHTWKLTIRTPDGAAVKNATIRMTGDMPAHGHGLPTQPKAGKGSEDGTYVVEGVKFSMPGWWNIALGITVNGAMDVASFNLQL